MDFETKIMLGFLVAFLVGLFIGWYVTLQKYHQEEEKRKAIKAHIAHEKIKIPPKTEWEEVIDVIAKLNNTNVDEYRIVYGETEFIMTPQTKQTEDKEL